MRGRHTFEIIDRGITQQITEKGIKNPFARIPMEAVKNELALSILSTGYVSMSMTQYLMYPRGLTL